MSETVKAYWRGQKSLKPFSDHSLILSCRQSLRDQANLGGPVNLDGYIAEFERRGITQQMYDEVVTYYSRPLDPSNPADKYRTYRP